MTAQHAPAYALINGQMQPCIILQWFEHSDHSIWVKCLYRSNGSYQTTSVSMLVCRTRDTFKPGLDNLISGHTPNSFALFVRRWYRSNPPPIDLLVPKGSMEEEE